MKVNKRERVLVVVDLLKGFVDEGALADKSIRNIIPEVVNLVEDFLDSGDDVIFMKDAHTDESSEFLSIPKHCVKGSVECEMVDELSIYSNRVISIEKNAICSTVVDSFRKIILGNELLKEVVIVGCETDMCVLGAAIPLKSEFNQLNRDVNVIVPMNGVATFNSENHRADDMNKMAFKIMSGAGVSIVKKYERRGK